MLQKEGQTKRVFTLIVLIEWRFDLDFTSCAADCQQSRVGAGKFCPRTVCSSGATETF